METCHCTFCSVEFVFGVSTTRTTGERSWEGVRASSVLCECVSLAPWSIMCTDILTRRSLQSHILVAFSVSLLGIGYWYFWVKWLPRKKRYRLVREWFKQDDGVSRWVYRKVPVLER